jgi:hypothetical protein
MRVWTERAAAVCPAGAGSVVDAAELRLRVLLAQRPDMPAMVIGESTGRSQSILAINDRVRVLCAERRADPACSATCFPGESAQRDPWSPPGGDAAWAPAGESATP